MIDRSLVFHAQPTVSVMASNSNTHHRGLGFAGFQPFNKSHNATAPKETVGSGGSMKEEVFAMV